MWISDQHKPRIGADRLELGFPALSLPVTIGRLDRIEKFFRLKTALFGANCGFKIAIHDFTGTSIKRDTGMINLFDTLLGSKRPLLLYRY